MAYEPQKSYLIDDYRVSPGEQLLTRAGEPIHLPKKPFEVLLYLIKNRGRFVSRAELLDTFWDGRDVYDDALRKCVGSIRRALEDTAGEPRFIETRWGVGYRYVGPVEEDVEPGQMFLLERTRGVSIVVEEEEIDTSFEPALSVAVSSRFRSFDRPAVLLMTLTVVVVSFAVGLVLISRKASKAAPAIQSIAVLPIKNLTGDASNEYLSDGLTEELITSLSRMQRVRVISRGSVFTYKDRNADPRDVGRSLGVETVLEGSLRREADRLRVDVRLVRTSDGEVLWAGDVRDRSVTDVFALQDETVREVAARLHSGTGTSDGQSSFGSRTDNPQAYEAYLKGRYFLNKRTQEGIAAATDQFLQAIRSDRNYAAAYAGLAESYNKACWFLAQPSEEFVVKQTQAAERAIALDDALPEAHAALSAAFAHKWDFARTLREAQRAVELNPGDAEVHHQNAYCLINAGREEDAVAEIKLARDLDPLNVVMNVDLGEILLYARQPDEAISVLKNALEMDPNRPNAHFDLALAYEMKGMSQDALAEHLANYRLNGGHNLDFESLDAFWHRMLEEDEAKLRSVYIPPIIIARIHARLGDRDAAFDWLEKAFNEHSPTLVGLKVDPELDPLRSDPRYADLVRRIGL